MFISRKQFALSFSRLKWRYAKSDDGVFDVWVNPYSPDYYSLIPINEASRNYGTYQNEAISILLSEIRENFPKQEIDDESILSHLRSDHYNLNSRIITENEFTSLELAKNLLNNQLISIMSLSGKGKQKQINKEEVNLGHTKKGSFILPIIIPTKFDRNLFDTDEIEDFLQKYLILLDDMTKLAPHNETDFASEAFALGIPSAMVKAFLGKNGIVQTSKNVSGNSNIIIDAQTNPVISIARGDLENKFRKANLGSTQPIPNDYVKVLKALESNQEDIIIESVEVIAFVDSINISKTVMFDIQDIASSKIPKGKIKKAQALHIEYSEYVEICKEAFSSIPGQRRLVKIKGDIEKIKGQTGPARLKVGKLELYVTNQSTIFPR